MTPDKWLSRNWIFVLYQRSCMIYPASWTYRKLITFSAHQNFILEKYDYNNNQKLQPVRLIKKLCAAGINILGKTNCSSVLETPYNLHDFRIHKRKSVLHVRGFSWEPKMERLRQTASKKTCFSLHLEEGKLCIQIFWLLIFTTVARKNSFFSRISVTMKKNTRKNYPEKDRNKEPQLFLGNVLFS